MLIDEIRNCIKQNGKLDAINISKLRTICKAMEKEQIADAYWDGVCNWDDEKNSYYWDQYYDQTFL